MSKNNHIEYLGESGDDDITYNFRNTESDKHFESLMIEPGISPRITENDLTCYIDRNITYWNLKKQEYPDNAKVALDIFTSMRIAFLGELKSTRS